ncbi:hypothetical protein [Isoptericola sp. NPDC055881]
MLDVLTAAVAATHTLRAIAAHAGPVAAADLLRAPGTSFDEVRALVGAGIVETLADGRLQLSAPALALLRDQLRAVGRGVPAASDGGTPSS